MRRAPWILAVAAASALAQPSEHELSTDAAPRPPSLDAAPAPLPPTPVLVVLADGQQLQGDLLAETEDAVTLRVGSGAPFQVSRSSIRSIKALKVEEDDGGWFHDTNATRYLYSPTGFMLRQGEGYFSQKELIVSSFGYGVTDHFSVVVGTVLPAWVTNFMNLGGGVKMGISVTELIHLAAGTQAFFVPASGFQFGLVVPHGTITYGTPRANATISAGGAFPFSPAGMGPPTSLISVGALYRMTPHVVLQTEHLLFPQVSVGFSGDPFMMFNSAGLRLMVRHWALDVGIVRFPGAPYALPWVDITYSFGGP